MRKVHVNLGARSYDIVIGAAIIDDAATLLRPLLHRMKVAIVTDEQALEANAPARISDALRTVWSAMGTSALATPIARLFYKRLVAANLLKQDLVLVHEMGLLTEHYQDAAKALITRSRRHRLEVAVALNRFTFFSPRNEFEQAILKAYKTPRIPYSVSNLLAPLFFHR